MTDPMTARTAAAAKAFRADSYFVCATPRTGSSLLLGLLASTGVCGHPQSYFRAPDEPLWADRWQLSRTADGGFDYVDYVRAARVAGSTTNGVFGAKLMWETLDEVIGKLRTSHRGDDDVALLNRVFGRTCFVYLRREDVLAQAISWLRAEQTNTWFIGGNGEISGNGGNGNAQIPVFDAAAIRGLMDVIEEQNTAWEARFTAWGIQPHRVSYEDLDGDMIATTHGILRFLGVDAPDRAPAVVARHQRQADELTRQWIRRYQAQDSDS